MFANRIEAATLLAQKLSRYRDQNPLVLAIPRGAVPMAEVIASELNGNLDVILVHKIGAPYQPEFAIGAVCENGGVYINPDIAHLSVPRIYLEKEVRHQRTLLKQRRQLYTPSFKAKDPKDRTVIVVDDGIATGSTMIAAIREVRDQHPKEIIVAAAVAPLHTALRLKQYADDTILLEQPDDFFAVDQYFEEFDQVTDSEVVQILNEFSKVHASSHLSR